MSKDPGQAGSSSFQYSTGLSLLKDRQRGTASPGARRDEPVRVTSWTYLQVHRLGRGQRSARLRERGHRVGDGPCLRMTGRAGHGEQRANVQGAAARRRPQPAQRLVGALGLRPRLAPGQEGSGGGLCPEPAAVCRGRLRSAPPVVQLGAGKAGAAGPCRSVPAMACQPGRPSSPVIAAIVAAESRSHASSGSAAASNSRTASAGLRAQSHPCARCQRSDARAAATTVIASVAVAPGLSPRGGGPRPVQARDVRRRPEPLRQPYPDGRAGARHRRLARHPQVSSLYNPVVSARIQDRLSKRNDGFRSARVRFRVWFGRTIR